MPIEIRELVIRARVEDQPSPASSEKSHRSSRPQMSNIDMQKIIAACAEEVLKVLNKKNER